MNSAGTTRQMDQLRETSNLSLGSPAQSKANRKLTSWEMITRGMQAYLTYYQVQNQRDTIQFRNLHLNGLTSAWKSEIDVIKGTELIEFESDPV